MAQGAVKAPGVVKGFEVFKEFPLGLGLGLGRCRSARLGLEGGEEGCGRGVVITVAFATPAGGEVLSGQSRPRGATGLLNAPVRMVPEA